MEWELVLGRNFLVLFLKEKNQKNFLWGLVEGLYVICTNIP